MVACGYRAGVGVGGRRVARTIDAVVATPCDCRSKGIGRSCVVENSFVSGDGS